MLLVYFRIHLFPLISYGWAQAKKLSGHFFAYGKKYVDGIVIAIKIMINKNLLKFIPFFREDIRDKVTIMCIVLI